MLFEAETFKIQRGPLNHNSEKLSGEPPHIGKTKHMFPYWFNNYKRKHKGKGNRNIFQGRFNEHYCLDGHTNTDDRYLSFSTNVKSISSRKKGKHFDKTDLKLYIY